MTVVLTSQAGAVRVTPIAFEPPENALAAICTATTFPTWTGAVGWCSEQGIVISNRDEARVAVDAESRPRQLALRVS